MSLTDKVERLLPEEIEKRSFEIIEDELKQNNIILPDDKKNVIKRVIHTSADLDYAKSLVFSDGAVEEFNRLIKEGATIVTDTNMALSGINKKALAKFNMKAYCFMADDGVARESKERGVTRACVSMEKGAKLDGPVIFVVGNGPTALIRLYEMIEEGSYRPAFIIGVPVGFVNVEVSKAMIMETDVPYIVNVGRKGGSNIAAAICNAFLYDAGGR